jgi:hypothetical protein
VPQLKRLEIVDANFGAGGEKVLRQAKSLEVLNASNAQMNDALVAQLKAQQKLHTLYLNRNPQVTDRGATQLGGLPALEILNLDDDPQVGNPTLGALRRCKNLRELKILHTNCQPAAVQALQKVLPDLKITGP